MAANHTKGQSCSLRADAVTDWTKVPGKNFAFRHTLAVCQISASNRAFHACRPTQRISL